MHWFEKFHWFITTEGFLVLSGKDAQQNELLFKRYLRPEDIYVHADIHGASSCIVRAKRKAATEVSIDVPNAIQFEDKYFVTPLAIQEAGVFAVCRSKAWSAKIITSSYWVRASQVSKTAPSGEYLTTGSLMIYGKKNYLPPMPLEMGFGILFRLDDSCLGRHLNDRKIKSYELDDESVVSFQDAVERYGIEEEGEEAGERRPETIPEEEEEEEEDDNINSDLPTKPVQQAIQEMSLTTNEDDEGKKDTSLNEEEEEVMEEEEADQDLEVEEEEATVNQKTASHQSQHKSGQHQGKGSDPIKPVKGSSSNSNASSNKKKLNKKKARRYAEQDEEDRELAMMILGHASTKGEKLTDQVKKAHQEKKKEDIKARQLKAGINLLQNSNWLQLLELQSPEVKEELQRLVQDQLLQEGDFNEEALKNLSLFSPEDGLRVLQLYRDSKQVEKIVNKSSYLHGIMRRVSKDNTTSKKVIAASIQKEKQQEKAEIQALNQEEGLLDLEEEEEMKFSEDVEKLYPSPTPEDIILYAVPVCAPYLSMKNFKFKVKLTPGTVKKGKAVKQAMEIFTHSKECSVTEKNMMKNLNDNELNAVMIGEVKLSMPGLFQQLQQNKGKKKSEKK